jgi:hypothetical protein
VTAPGEETAAVEEVAVKEAEEVAPVEAESSAKPKSDKLPAEGEGTDWVADDGTHSIPDGFSIKGNASSRIYHPIESPSYEATDAEIYFASPEAAERHGFRLPKTMQHAGTATADAASAVAEAAADKVEESTEE